MSEFWVLSSSRSANILQEGEQHKGSVLQVLILHNVESSNIKVT